MLVEADIAPNQPYKLTIHDFELLAAAGAFRDNKRVELIDGRIVLMSPVHRRHYRAHTQLVVRLSAAVLKSGSNLEVNIGPSVAIPPYSEPLPDIVISAVPESDKAIEVAAARLIVEIADSTANYDLRTKAQLYAEAGIPEYWVINLQKSEIDQFWAPAGSAFTQEHKIGLGQPITSQTLPDLTIDTAGPI